MKVTLTYGEVTDILEALAARRAQRAARADELELAGYPPDSISVLRLRMLADRSHALESKLVAARDGTEGGA